jgi:hypothetical protein
MRCADGEMQVDSLGGSLTSFAGGSTLPGEGLDTDFISSFSLAVEAKIKSKKNICEACIIYKELCLVFTCSERLYNVDIESMYCGQPRHLTSSDLSVLIFRVECVGYLLSDLKSALLPF